MTDNEMTPRDIAFEEPLLYEVGYHNADYSGPIQLTQSAEFMARDSDLWVFRRFEKLHLFNISRIQQHLTRLENDLEAQISGSKKAQDDKLLPDIQRTLKEYDAALSAQAKYKSYRQPENRVIKHIQEWAPGNGPALHKGLNMHRGGSMRVQDLASIASTEKTWIHSFIDRHNFLRKKFAEPKTTENELWSTLVYSEESVRNVEAIFLHASFCILLLCPVFALLYLNSLTWKLVVLVISLLAASLLSAGFLNTPNKSSLALVAGYAAIMVVFFSNNVRT